MRKGCLPPLPLQTGSSRYLTSSLRNVYLTNEIRVLPKDSHGGEPYKKMMLEFSYARLGRKSPPTNHDSCPCAFRLGGKEIMLGDH